MCVSSVCLCLNLGTIFTIVPTTQYVWINQTATFTCATNVTGYELVFNIPGVDVEQESNAPLPGGGQTITAIFTATLDTNGTNVTCGALMEFTLIDTTKVVQILVQGNIINMVWLYFKHFTATFTFFSTDVSIT